MAYDIHIAKTKREAQRNKPVLSIDEREHEFVFSALDLGVSLSRNTAQLSCKNTTMPYNLIHDNSH